MKKLIYSITAALTAVFLTVPALADIIWEPFPAPAPEDPLPGTPPVSTPEPTSALLAVLAVAVLAIAAAILVRTIIRKRKGQ